MEDRTEERGLFPITFTQCPNCGSERTVTSVLVEEERAKGKFREGAGTCISMIQNVIVDPGRTVLIAPQLTTLLDACYDCGTVYMIGATVKTVALTAELKR